MDLNSTHFNRLLRTIEDTRELSALGCGKSSWSLLIPNPITAELMQPNFALVHDDGISTSYDEADIILLGVSRSGKTPTCLYLAL